MKTKLGIRTQGGNLFKFFFFSEENHSETILQSRQSLFSTKLEKLMILKGCFCQAMINVQRNTSHLEHKHFLFEQH